MFVAGLVLVLEPGHIHAAIVGTADIAALQTGVVRITATPSGGPQKVGTGFIVRLERDVVYIVTAAHVIAGDVQPTVQFFTQQDLSVQATVKHSEGGDEVTGLALLIVRGKDRLPSGLTSLTLASASRMSGNDEIILIGHPRGAGDWAILRGSIASRQGRYVIVDANIDEGNSGGPIIQNGEVVGIVGGVTRYGRGLTSGSVREYLEGHGISSQEAPAAVAKVQPTPSIPITPEKPVAAPSREITGKDGAPMVLIPAGSFWMGATRGDVNAHQYNCANETWTDWKTGEVKPAPVSPENCLNRYRKELPRHEVKIGAFYLDAYEVSNQRFKQFRDQTGYRTRAEQIGRGGGFAWESTANGRWYRYRGELEGATWMMPDGETSIVDANRLDHPVTVVSWDDAQAYCRWVGKRLPTEAEWEYAARAGTSTMYWWGDGPPRDKAVENVADETYVSTLPDWRRFLRVFAGYTDGYFWTAPVGSFVPNPWGLYDMLGNVSEWVSDSYREDYYAVSPHDNPRGPQEEDTKVSRGGNFSSWYLDFRAADRGTWQMHRTSATNTIGFRCAQDGPK
mgnify:CR=1 FL=1